MGSVKSNIWKLYLLNVFIGFFVVVPTIVLFYQENGLSLGEVFLLQSIYSLGIIAFEIPSGFFSDVVGRRKTLIIGTITYFAGYLVYSLSYNFSQFVFAEIIISFGSSFISGTDSALLYDTLLQLKKEDEYKKTEGRLMSLGRLSGAVASVIGGFAAVISLRTPFYIQTAVVFFAIIVSLTFIEPKRQKYETKENPLREIMNVVKYSLHGNKSIKWLILYSAFLGASTRTVVWFSQPYFKLVGLPLPYFGIVIGLLNYSVAMFSLYAHKVEKFLGRKGSLISLLFIIFAGYVLMSVFNSLWAISFIVLFYFVRGVSGPVLKDYVNKITSSSIRATVLSVRSLISSIAFSILGPFVGWLSDAYSLQQALLASGAIFFALGMVSLFYLHKNKAL